MTAKFIHLHVQTSYSLGRSTVKIEEIINLCHKYHMPAVAVTEFGNLFSALEFSVSAAKNGIQPILGCTLGFDAQISNSRNKIEQIVLIVKNKIGYKNLLKLVSKSFLEQSDKQFIKLNDLRQHNEGLICLTAGQEGSIAQLILENNKVAATKLLLDLKEIFANRLYIEIIRQGLESQQKSEKTLIDLAYEHNIPLVATNNVFFTAPEMHEAHDALLCISQSRYLLEEDREKSVAEAYFKNSKAMINLFADLPEAINNTVSIAKRCCYMAEERSPMLPKTGENEDFELRRQAKEGLTIRLVDIAPSEQDKYWQRLEFELDVIINMKFPGYFLIVSDFIKWSKRNDIPVGPGRGSGAGSLVAWSLFITDLDPIRFGLLFERFLNPERISMPDFDIDFCQIRRDEVIKYVSSKYGSEKVAHIITFGKLQARAVIRDVGRVMQMPYSQVDKISKLIPFNPTNPVSLLQAIEMEKMLKKTIDEDDQVKKLISIALKLEGLHRHASIHAAGIVIADRNLDELVPIYKDYKADMLIVQYSMKYAEMAGLVKFDFLGLKTLTVIANSCHLINNNKVILDINKIPFNDSKTYKILSEGKSVGIFQFESVGMRDTLRKMRPDTIEDLIALGALYRPGPMDNIPIYIACKHKLQKPDYLHPKLEGILKETFGVIIYQEQVMQIAQILAGYSLGSADLLRRAMGKKIKSEMDAQRELFVKGSIDNGVDKDQASNIFDLVAKFAGYGFNKSHAAAYALISYQTAYLKANYPLEFLVASLNLEIDDTDKIFIFVQEAKSLGINILPPDINRSEACFSIEGNSIRFALGALKNVGVSAMESLTDIRQDSKGFSDIFDFAKKVNNKILNKRQMENLIKSGAFDTINSNRKQLFDSIDIILSYSSFTTKNQESNQISLFESYQIVETVPNLATTDDWLSDDKIINEYEAFGFYLNNHPLDKYQTLLATIGILDSEFIRETLNYGSKEITIVGVITNKKTRVSPRGRYVSLLLSDCTGSFEVSIYDEGLLVTNNEILAINQTLHLVVEARKDEGGTKLIAKKIENFDHYLISHNKKLQIWLKNTDGINDIKDILTNNETKFGMKVTIITTTHHGYLSEINLKQYFSLKTKDLFNLENLKGVDKLELV